MISEDRQIHFAHVVIDGLWKDDLVDYGEDEVALRIAKRTVREFIDEEDRLDDTVRMKIQSLKRTVIEGTEEWDTMYRKYYEEELIKRGQS